MGELIPFPDGSRPEPAPEKTPSFWERLAPFRCISFGVAAAGHLLVSAFWAFMGIFAFGPFFGVLFGGFMGLLWTMIGLNWWADSFEDNYLYGKMDAPEWLKVALKL